MTPKFKTFMLSLAVAATALTGFAHSAAADPHRDDDRRDHDAPRYSRDDDRHGDARHGNGWGRYNNGYTMRESWLARNPQGRLVLVQVPPQRYIAPTYYESVYYNEGPTYIVDRDRAAIRSYLVRNNYRPHPHAPRFTVGEVLYVQPQNIWTALANLLTPPQPGYRYVRVDNDVLLISEPDRRIVDVVAWN